MLRSKVKDLSPAFKIYVYFSIKKGVLVHNYCTYLRYNLNLKNMYIVTIIGYMFNKDSIITWWPLIINDSTP